MQLGVASRPFDAEVKNTAWASEALFHKLPLTRDSRMLQAQCHVDHMLKHNVAAAAQGTATSWPLAVSPCARAGWPPVRQASNLPSYMAEQTLHSLGLAGHTPAQSC